MSTGTSELSTETLSAVVYCRPIYCPAVKSAPPTMPSQSKMPQCVRITGQSRLICGNAMNPSAMVGKQPAHRRNADRRNLAANGAADDVVAGPEQRGERQQEVGVVVNPAAPGRRFILFTGHGRASQQSRAARTVAAAAKADQRNLAVNDAVGKNLQRQRCEQDRGAPADHRRVPGNEHARPRRSRRPRSMRSRSSKSTTRLGQNLARLPEGVRPWENVRSLKVPEGCEQHQRDEYDERDDTGQRHVRFAPGRAA